MIRALRFLEGFLQRDALQKAAFLKDLEGLWSRCDARVLRYRVLPPLLGEARNEQLQPIILPLIMGIVHKQDSQVCPSRRVHLPPEAVPSLAASPGMDQNQDQNPLLVAALTAFDGWQWKEFWSE